MSRSIKPCCYFVKGVLTQNKRFRHYMFEITLFFLFWSRTTTSSLFWSILWSRLPDTVETNLTGLGQIHLMCTNSQKYSVDQWRAEVWWCPGRLLDCMPPSDARLFWKNKQVNLKNKPKIGNLTEKQTQKALAGKFNKSATKFGKKQSGKQKSAKKQQISIKTSPKTSNPQV